MPPQKITSVWAWTEYSTVCPWSARNKWLLLIHEDHFGLYEGQTGAFVRDLPLPSNSEPRWDKSASDVCYFLRGNQVLALNVAASTSTTVREFSFGVRGLGESDISEDGDYLVLCGDGRFIFTLNLRTGARGQASAAAVDVDSLYVTPDNHVLISHVNGGAGRGLGIEMFDLDMNFMRQVTTAGGHMDVGRNAAGEECVFWCNSNDRNPVAPNALVEVRLADGRQTPLLTLPWDTAFHVCAVPGAVFLDTYYPDRRGGDILRVDLSTGAVRSIAQHNSWGNTYEGQPRVVVSGDGEFVAWSSNVDGTPGVWMLDGRVPVPVPVQILGARPVGEYVELYGIFPDGVQVEVTYRSAGQVNVRLKA